MTIDAIDKLLREYEKNAKDINTAEYLKLYQLRQELAEDEPKEITVSWVESPESDAE